MQRIQGTRTGAETQREKRAAAQRKKEAASTRTKDSTDRQLLSDTATPEPSEEPEPYPEEWLRFLAESPWNYHDPQESKSRGVVVRLQATFLSFFDSRWTNDFGSRLVLSGSGVRLLSFWRTKPSQ